LLAIASHSCFSRFQRWFSNSHRGFAEHIASLKCKKICLPCCCSRDHAEFHKIAYRNAYYSKRSAFVFFNEKSTFYCHTFTPHTHTHTRARAHARTHARVQNIIYDRSMSFCALHCASTLVLILFDSKRTDKQFLTTIDVYHLSRIMSHYDRHTRGIASVSLVFDTVWLWSISFTIHNWLQSTCIVYRWISRLNRRKRSSIVPKTENMFLSLREMQIENLFDIIYSLSYLFVSVFSRLFPKNMENHRINSLLMASPIITIYLMVRIVRSWW